MELKKYSIKEIILSGLKSEIDARDLYNAIADNVNNAILKDRLKFLAGEEEKHRIFFVNLYRAEFHGEEPEVPEDTPVPLPIVVYNEDSALTEVIEQAMESEQAAAEFYNEFAKITDDEKLKNTLKMFANMEMGHYRILEAEKENLERFEDYENEVPMIHLGP